MPHTSRLFYQYSGVHSLLIGILPFFLPALMWEMGSSLSEISWFIALSGIGYLLSLILWDRSREWFGWKTIIIISFLLELALVTFIVLDQAMTTIYWIALLNGAYGCFFWMSQRSLFVTSSDSINTARRFGNFQIVVMILLKVGILMGAYLWQEWGPNSVFWLTLAVLLPVLLYLLTTTLPEHLTGSVAQPLALKSIFKYHDNYSSRLVFFIDGLFLFAESYFWLISLYLVAGENLMSLGILVVSLSILLAIIFYLIKNSLDRIRVQRVYIIAVIAYALSWLLRGTIEIDNNQLWLYPLIIFIAFLTALFRLAFNKRFFDIAAKLATHEYLVMKSYYSQAGIALLFCLAGLLLNQNTNSFASLQIFYWVLVPISIIFILYREPDSDSKPT